MTICQGCGEETDSRLCCPKCTEIGRTCFFCNQKCFSDSWKAHSKLHVIMQQSIMTSSHSRAPGGMQTMKDDGVDDISCSTAASASGPSSTECHGEAQRGDVDSVRSATNGCVSDVSCTSELPVVPRRVARGVDAIQARRMSIERLQVSDDTDVDTNRGVSRSWTTTSVLRGLWKNPLNHRSSELPLRLSGKGSLNVERGRNRDIQQDVKSLGQIAHTSGVRLSRGCVLLTLACFIAFGCTMYIRGLLDTAISPRAGFDTGVADPVPSTGSVQSEIQSLKELLHEVKSEVTSLSSLVHRHEAFLGRPSVADSAGRQQRSAGALGSVVANRMDSTVSGPPVPKSAAFQKLLELANSTKDKKNAGEVRANETEQSGVLTSKSYGAVVVSEPAVKSTASLSKWDRLDSVNAHPRMAAFSGDTAALRVKGNDKGSQVGSGGAGEADPATRRVSLFSAGSDLPIGDNLSSQADTRSTPHFSQSLYDPSGSTKAAESTRETKDTVDSDSQGISIEGKNSAKPAVVSEMEKLNGSEDKPLDAITFATNGQSGKRNKRGAE